MLGISLSTLQRLIDEGYLRASRPAGSTPNLYPGVQHL